jgi:hypothetical protein
MREGTKLSAREAYKEYCNAARFKPDNFDIRKKRDLAYDAAVTKVIIASMQNFGGYQLTSPTLIQNFQTEIIRMLSSNMNNEFIRFYTEWEARNKEITPDQVMELNLSRVTIGQPMDEKNTREVSKQVVVKDIVYKPDSVVHQYGTVYAKIISIKRTLISQGDLAITVRDTRGQTIWNDHFIGQHQWQTEFATYTGDERALTDDDKTMCNKTDYNPPAQDKIMQNLLHQIQSDVASRLRGYYVKNQF